jgi:hypothetical protein
VSLSRRFLASACRLTATKVLILEDGGNLPPPPHLSQLVDKVSTGDGSRRADLTLMCGLAQQSVQPYKPLPCCCWLQEYNVYERDINNKDGAYCPVGA